MGNREKNNLFTTGFSTIYLYFFNKIPLLSFVFLTICYCFVVNGKKGPNQRAIIRKEKSADFFRV